MIKLQPKGISQFNLECAYNDRIIEIFYHAGLYRWAISIEDKYGNEYLEFFDDLVNKDSYDQYKAINKLEIIMHAHAKNIITNGKWYWS